MLDKNRDTFFDDDTSGEQQSEQLLKMIDSYGKTVRTDIVQGSHVTGTVTRIGTEYAFVDIGGKNEALIKLSEIMDHDGQPTIKAGEQLTAYVVSETPGETMLSRSMGGHTAAVKELIDAMENKVPVQGKVTGVNKGGFNIKIMGNRAFCPVSQIDLKFTEDVNSFLGKNYDFVITRVTEGGRNIVVSRIPLLEGDLESKIDALAEAIASKAVRKGRITRITDFGLFVDMGEMEGLVHISEISWERMQNLAESFEIGQEVEFIVLKVEKREPLRHSKISLSIKHVLDDPWTTVSTRLSVGQTIEGRVTRITNFGAFVELIPGIEGLVHISEMAWGKRIHHPSEVVTEGNIARATILSIDEAKRAVSLSLKDVSNDPWREADQRFPVGSDIVGVVAKKARYGYFIDLAEGVTGLLVYSNIVDDKKETLKEGDQVTVHVEAVDIENRRVSLSLGVKEIRQDAAEVKQFIQKQRGSEDVRKSGSTDFGSALLEALKKKNT